MKTVRRLYLYGIAFVSLEAIIWGIIGLLRNLISQTLTAPEAILRALSLLLVGAPVFLFHWLWGKRLATEDAEEAGAMLRAVFFYGVLLANGIPVFQNLLAILNRWLLSLFGLPTSRALFGGAQSLSDNLIAILIAGLFWGYFWQQLTQAWQKLTESENFADTRRLYRFIWMLYGLLLLIAGVIQILRVIFYWPVPFPGDPRPTALNGLGFVLIGGPLWYFAWRKCQENAQEAAERTSLLRLGVYTLLSLGSALVILVDGIILLDILLQWMLGLTPLEASRFGDALAWLISFGMVRAYYARWFKAQLEFFPADRAQEIRRFVHGLLSLAGLIAVSTGMGILLNLLADLLAATLFSEGARRSLGHSLSALLLGLPYWLVNWNALRLPETQPQASPRSLARRAYLYLILFGSVLAVMGYGAALVYQTLRGWLLQENDLRGILSSLFLLAFFGVLLLYHLKETRRETAQERARFADFRILLLMEDAESRAALESALKQSLPGAQIIHLERSAAPIEGEVLIYPAGSEALPEWARDFPGTHLLIPWTGAKNRLWVGALNRRWPEQAARMARQLALGEELRQPFQSPTIWTILGYLFAIFFALQLLGILLGVALSLVAD